MTTRKPGKAFKLSFEKTSDVATDVKGFRGGPLLVTWQLIERQLIKRRLCLIAIICCRIMNVLSIIGRHKTTLRPNQEWKLTTVHVWNKSLVSWHSWPLSPERASQFKTVDELQTDYKKPKSSKFQVPMFANYSAFKRLLSTAPSKWIKIVAVNELKR